MMVLSMDHGNKDLNTKLTFAIARDVPTAVVIAAHSSRLSRMFHWDLKNNTFTPSQFLKARAMVMAISADGRYCAYRVDASHKREQSYTCIARVPFFTALAFFPHYSYDRSVVQFLDNGDIFVLAKRKNLSWVKEYGEVKERVTPGFKNQILRDWRDLNLGFVDQILAKTGLSLPSTWNDQQDNHRQRRIWTENNELHAKSLVTGSSSILREFTRETFEEVEPPDWAKVW